MHTLHIRCGSDIHQGLSNAGIEGDFLEFADPFCIGPVRAQPLQMQIRERARFIADALGHDPLAAFERMQGEYAALDSLDDYDHIVLWFEHDSYDQLILAYLLSRLDEQRPNARVELIAIDHAPGIERFIGLGQLDPSQLRWAWEQRQPIGEAQYRLGSEVWKALVEPSPEPLYDITQHDTPALPLMAPALRRHLQELPELDSGLRLTERLILELLDEHSTLTIGQAFNELNSHRDPLPFLGDTLFACLVKGIAIEPAPLLYLNTSGPEEGDLRARLSLTPIGAQVLAGERHRLDLHPPGRWVGGTLSPGIGGAWCWDAQRGEPVWRPATA